MKIPSRWRPYVEACVALPPGSDVQSRASELVQQAEASRVRCLTKSLGRRKAEAATEEQQAAGHAELVRRARVRDGHLCQLCPEDLPWDIRCAQPGDPLEPNHLELGSGKTGRERLSNLITAHSSCHEAFHSNAKPFIARVKAWCVRNRYPLPNRKEYRS